MRGWILIVALAAGCHERAAPGPIGGMVAIVPPSIDAAPAPPSPPPEPDAAIVVDAPPAIARDIDSADILARPALATEAEVKHVLIGWQELAPNYHGAIDPRAATRTNEAAAVLALEVAAQLQRDVTQIDALMQLHSEDPGSITGASYTVKADGPFVPEFKNLALRLHDNEVGIVKSTYGYHVMLRMPPDPLISRAILARAPTTDTVHIQHVLIGWASTSPRDPRAEKRTKAEADKLAKATLARVKAGADMTKLMAELSEDPGSKGTGKAYDVDPTSAMVEGFKDLALRLRIGEAGLAKTQFGWHVMKRVRPPPPDRLESSAILARKPVTARAKVQHVLLGWIAVHADDDRGKTRTRAELEKLVAATLARAKHGEAFEVLMAELSEDPGSAKSGQSYDVTPEAGLVAPFKALSLRLNVGELGVVLTDFGIHIIKRVE